MVHRCIINAASSVATGVVGCTGFPVLIRRFSCLLAVLAVRFSVFPPRIQVSDTELQPVLAAFDRCKQVTRVVRVAECGRSALTIPTPILCTARYRKHRSLFDGHALVGLFNSGLFIPALLSYAVHGRVNVSHRRTRAQPICRRYRYAQVFHSPANSMN